MIAASPGSARVKRDAAIVGQRRIERNCARCDLDDEPSEPVVGYEIKQCRSGDQIHRPIERGLEIAVKVERHRQHVHASDALLRRARQQAEIIVDQPPILLARKCGDSARRVDPVPQARSTIVMRRMTGKRCGNGIEDGRIARPRIIGLAQREPFRGETRSCDRLQRARKELRGILPGGKP